MSEKTNLKEIEKKAWASYFEDGLWDIFMSLLMLGMGLRTLTDNVWYTLVIWVGVLVMLVGKKLVTTPRIGRVKFGRSRKVKRRKVIAIVSISVVATFVLLLLGILGLAPSRMVTAPIFVVGIALVFGLMAYFMDFPRLYAYGLLFAISIALTEALWPSRISGIAFVVSGGIALLIGLVMLVRFLAKYPLPAEMKSYGGD